MDKSLSGIDTEHALRLEQWPVYERLIHVHETDKDGVMHFSNYFKIAEEALYSGLRKLGFSFENTEFSMAMINTSADYIHPIRFAEQLRIVFTGVKVSRVKIKFMMDFLDSNQTALAKVQLFFVLIEPEGRKAIPVPGHLKSTLSLNAPCSSAF
ncbi:MAG: thioesterase family protein [Nitrosomonas sp.]|nr:thioesterase family protein [Nitrosomonas sp.]